MQKQNKLTPNGEMRRKYIPCESAGKDQTCKEYFKMLREKGLWVNQKVFPSYFKLKNGLVYEGMATTEYIEPNQVFVKIPRNLVLDSLDAVSCEQLQELFKDGFYRQPKTWKSRTLNTFMLHIYNKGQKDTVWYQMISQLSKNIDILSMWPEEDLKKFADQQIRLEAKKGLQAFEKEWKLFEQAKEKYELLQNPIFSKQNYRWIYIHLSSRTFSSKVEFITFTPYCEYINHHIVHGPYYVQNISSNNENNNEKNKSAETVNTQQQNLEQTQSLTTEGSCQSQEFFQDGQFNYEMLQNVGQVPKQENISEVQTIKQMKKKVLDFLESKLKWNELNILFTIKIYEKCCQIERSFNNQAKNYAQAQEQLKKVYKFVEQYCEQVVKYYKKCHRKTYKNYIKVEGQQKQQAQKPQYKYGQNPDYVQFPKAESKPYDHFVLAFDYQFKPNNQIYFQYGNDSNLTLLSTYGFSMEGNKYDSVRISFDWKKYANFNNNSLVSWMKQKNVSLKRKFRVRINKLNMDLITFFRLVNWEYNDQSKASQIFSVKNYEKEIKLLQSIKQELLSVLPKYEKMPLNLQDQNLTYHEYFITTYHVEKVRILKQQVQFMDKLISFIQQLKSNNKAVSQIKAQLSFQENFIFKFYLNQCQNDSSN